MSLSSAPVNVEINGTALPRRDVLLVQRSRGWIFSGRLALEAGEQKLVQLLCLEPVQLVGTSS